MQHMFHHKDKIGFSLLPLVTGVMCGSSNLFLYCFFGKWATESYANMTYYVYEADWPSAPVATQKYFILMIANMQRPLYYHGFGIAVLNLETFAKVRTKQKPILVIDVFNRCVIFTVYENSSNVFHDV